MSVECIKVGRVMVERDMAAVASEWWVKIRSRTPSTAQNTCCTSSFSTRFDTGLEDDEDDEDFARCVAKCASYSPRLLVNWMRVLAVMGGRGVVDEADGEAGA
jgi:hypothetical protein